jgi:hypothetical protein
VPRNLWQPGQSGNPAGRKPGSRNQLTEMVVCALLRDFRLHGQKAIARVRRENPAVYLRVLGMLVPREHKIEATDPLARLSDEMLEQMVQELEERIARRARGDDAKLIEGSVETTPAL